MSRELARRYDSTATSRDRDDDDDGLDPGRLSRSELLRKPSFAVASGLVQRKARDANGVAEGAEHVVAAASSSSGMSLPDHLMRKFESSLGADLSGVRVHTGDASAAANDAVGAKAYTMGSDIHFAAGHYDPSSVDGEHLLAHEVAHTVQQGGGAQRMQFKLAVSSPGDAMEHEADRAADAMVSGAPASISGGAAGLARMPMPPSPAGLVTGGDVTLSIADKEWTPPIDAGPFEITPHASLSITLAAPSAEPKDGKAPVSVGAEASKDKVKAAADVELGETTWGLKSSAGATAEMDKDGKPKISAGATFTHDGMQFENLQVGPWSVTASAFEWAPGKKPKFAFVDINIAVKGKGKDKFMGRDVSVAITGGAAIEPDWKQIIEWCATNGAAVMTALINGAGAAIAAPAVAAAVMLYAWSKAGHEFDQLQRRIEGLRAQCLMASHEALTGKHTPVNVAGVDVNAAATKMGADIRALLIAEMKLPEGAFEAIAKAKPGIESRLYKIAWNAAWSKLRGQLLEEYKDTTFTSNLFERMWIESFDTGDFSEK